MEELKIPIILILLSLTCHNIIAGTVCSDPEKEADHIVKVLAFDRKLDERTKNNTVKIWLIYREKKSVEYLEKLQRYLENPRLFSTLNGKVIKTVLVKYRNPISFKKSIENFSVSMLYLSVDLRRNLSSILQVSRSHNVATISGASVYASLGVSVTFLCRKKNQLELVINASAAREEEFDLPSSLLKLSK